MSDSALVPGWSNRGTQPTEDQEPETDAKRVETPAVEDKAIKAPSAKRTQK